MRKFTYSMMLLAVLLAQQAPAEEASITSRDKKNYEIGVQLVRVLSKLGGEINLDMVIKGMRDALKDETLIARRGSARKTRLARSRSLSRDRLRPPETGRAGSGADAAARMTISGGTGGIIATPGRAWNIVNQYGYRYYDYARTR